MKNSVLSQAMSSLRTNGMTDVYSIIALASLCDFAFKHRMIAQLMPNSFSEDLKYFSENFEEFKVLKDSLQDFEIFSSNENDLFYVGPRFPGPLLIRTRCPDTSPNSSL